MTLERYFPTLKPPKDGLLRLQIRLQKRPTHWQHRLMSTRPALATAAACCLIVLSVLMLQPSDQDRFYTELQQVFATATSQEVSINGQAANARLSSDGQVLFYLQDQSATEN